MNKLNIRLLVVAMISLFANPLTGKSQDLQTVILKSGPTSSINVPSGKLIEIDSALGGFKVTIGGDSSDYFYNGHTYVGHLPLKFVGPLTVSWASAAYSEATAITYRIVDNITTSSGTPANTVVIPTSANGNVSIILESSTDLVSWTAALPGTYDSSTSKRFFRVRASTP